MREAAPSIGRCDDTQHDAADSQADAMQGKTETQPVRWWNHPQLLLRYVLSLDDTPHHIALGSAIGIFVGLTPTPGLQMLLVAAAYYVFRPVLKFNLPAGLAATYASNPITALPLAWTEYQVGRFFVGGNLTRAELGTLLEYRGLAAWWENVTSVFSELGWAYLIGSLVVAAIGAMATYPLMHYLLHLFHARLVQVTATEDPGTDPLALANDRAANTGPAPKNAGPVRTA